MSSSVVIPRAFKLRLEYDAATGKMGTTYLNAKHSDFIIYGLHDMTEKQKASMTFDCMKYWQGMIIGVQGLQCGQVYYQFAVMVPESYPQQPPIIRFATAIALPCVDARGYVDVSRIPNFTWSPHMNIADVLMAIREAMGIREYILESAKRVNQVFFNFQDGDRVEQNFA